VYRRKGTRDYNGLKVMKLNMPEFLLPSRISGFKLSLYYSIIFTNSYASYNTHLAFEFQLSFQNLQEFLFPNWLNSFADFPCSFSYWLINILKFSRRFLEVGRALYWPLKSEMSSLLAIVKIQKHINKFFKGWESLLAALEDSIEIQKLFEHPA